MTMFAAIAVSLAAPQAQPAAPAAHAGHATQPAAKDHSGMAGKMDCCKDCCKNKAAAKAKVDPHAGHDMSKSADGQHKHQ